MNVNEAKVLVTGGSSGIGGAAARLLIAEGAQVAICGREEDNLRRAVEDMGALATLRRTGGRTMIVNGWGEWLTP